jgi:TetR/AcrR family transcriptional regulator, copper-responsive repressor
MKKNGEGRTGRPREFDRDAALATAMMLFWRHGFENVSIAQLTDAIGIAPASLYAAFGCKALLYEEALGLYQRHRTALLDSYLEEDRPILDVLADVFQTAAEAMTDPACPPGCMVSSGMLLHATEHTRAADSATAARQRLGERLAARLRRAIEVGEIPETVDVDDLSRYFTSLMHGMSVQACDGATREQLVSVARLGLAAIFSHLSDSSSLGSGPVCNAGNQVVDAGQEQLQDW